MVVVEMVVHWEFFDHWSVVWSLRVVWTRSPRGRSRCERIALERVQLRVHVDEVAALVDNLACKRGTDFQENLHRQLSKHLIVLLL